jgi:hypothetical protein
MTEEELKAGKVDRSQVTQFNLGRGVIGGFRFAVWDYVAPCQGKKCILHNHCTYKDPTAGIKGKHARKCGIERYYMGVVLKPFFELAEKLRDPFIMQWIGLHMVPLYGHLIKLKKYERSLGSPMEVTLKGDCRVNPVYREIRNVIVAIRKEWKYSGLVQAAKDEGYLGAMPHPLGNMSDDDIDGDPNYHDNLYGEEDAD